jgi:hypothetical protein
MEASQALSYTISVYCKLFVKDGYIKAYALYHNLLFKKFMYKIKVKIKIKKFIYEIKGSFSQ